MRMPPPFLRLDANGNSPNLRLRPPESLALPDHALAVVKSAGFSAAAFAAFGIASSSALPSARFIRNSCTLNTLDGFLPPLARMYPPSSCISRDLAVSARYAGSISS